jgi:hypothetical protein
MAIVANDHVIPRSILGTSLNGSGLLAQPPIVGVVTDVTVTIATVLWHNGHLATGMDVADGTTSPLLKVAAPAAGPLAALAGKTAQLTGASPEFSGPVIQVLGIELDPLGAAGVFTDCVIVQSRGPSQAYWIATVASVSVIE